MQPTGRPKYRLTVKLDLERDAEIVAWLSALPEGERSQAARAALRRGLRGQPIVNMEAIRQVISEELSRAFEGKTVVGNAPEKFEPMNEDRAEAAYGSKLNQMMSGVTRKPDTQDET